MGDFYSPLILLLLEIQKLDSETKLLAFPSLPQLKVFLPLLVTVSCCKYPVFVYQDSTTLNIRLIFLPVGEDDLERLSMLGALLTSKDPRFILGSPWKERSLSN